VELTRRQFLGRVSSAALMAGFSYPSLNLSGSIPEPHISFPSAVRDRIAIASYPFRAYIDSPTNRERDHRLPGMDLKGFASMMAERFKVRHIEPYSAHFLSLKPDYLVGLSEAWEKVGIGPVNIAVDGGASFYDRDPRIRNQAIGFAKQWVDVAVAIRSPSIRTNNPQASNSGPDLERMIDSLRTVVEYAARRNVVVNLENDDPVSEDPLFIVKVIEGVRHPYLRALPDFGNSLAGGDVQFNRRALEDMFRHAYSICHVKDGGVSEGGKSFDVDVEGTFGILKASGYRGYCSIEFDRPGDPYGPTARLVEQSIAFLS
jgi:sugar phosphate isomerase/epimerase